MEYRWKVITFQLIPHGLWCRRSPRSFINDLNNLKQRARFILTLFISLIKGCTYFLYIHEPLKKYLGREIWPVLLTKEQLRHLHINNRQFLSCSGKTQQPLLGYGSYLLPWLGYGEINSCLCGYLIKHYPMKMYWREGDKRFEEWKSRGKETILTRGRGRKERGEEWE
jgi:hypothetical protein